MQAQYCAPFDRNLQDWLCRIKGEPADRVLAVDLWQACHSYAADKLDKVQAFSGYNAAPRLSFRDWLRRARHKQGAYAAAACKTFKPCIE